MQNEEKITEEIVETTEETKQKKIKREKKKKEKNPNGGFKEFFAKIKGKLKGKTSVIIQGALILLVAVLLVQNSQMLGQMKKILNQSEGSIHEVYDNTKVVNAYKTEDTADDQSLSAEDAFVLEKASEVIKEVITDDMTPYEKEKAIYEWQVKWVSFNDQSLTPLTGGSDVSHTPYGVLKYHQAICVGNATTFKLFMDMLDIPCRIIHSTQNGEHAWDVVQLDDEWYHVDVTFDGGNNGTPGYSCFNVPDSIKDDGAWPWDHSEIPVANGTKYCYILQNAKVADDFYGIPQIIKDAMDAKETSANVILKDNKGFTRDIADYIGNNMMMQDGSVYYENAYSLDGKVVYKFSISRWNEDPNNEEHTEIYNKLSEIIGGLGLMGSGDDGGDYQNYGAE